MTDGPRFIAFGDCKLQVYTTPDAQSTMYFVPSDWAEQAHREERTLVEYLRAHPIRFGCITNVGRMER